jgi:hypothetical protein
MFYVGTILTKKGDMSMCNSIYLRGWRRFSAKHIGQGQGGTIEQPQLGGVGGLVTVRIVAWRSLQLQT